MSLSAPPAPGKSHPPPSPENLEDAALRLSDLGLSVIPIRSGTKAPPKRFEWTPYRTRRPAQKEWRLWSQWPTVAGLAIIHGKASGNLAARDFDVQSSYDRWAEAYPALAASLPTSISRRGPKVYFRVEREHWCKLADGEFIGNALHYTCIPPTVHPDTGLPYVWKIPFDRLPPVLDPVECGLLPPVELELNTSPYTISNVKVGTQTYIGGGGEGDLRGVDGYSDRGIGDYRNEDIGRMIMATLPTGEGERNDSLFRLARRLKTLPGFQNAPAKELMPIVAEWHRLALSAIATKDWRVTWSDFCRQWRRVRSGGEGAVLVCIKEHVAARTNDPLLRLEMACEIIHCRLDGAPFYLSCRTAGELIGTSKTEAARLLRRLLDAGILAIEVPAAKGKRKAATYRYHGPELFALGHSVA